MADAKADILIYGKRRSGAVSKSRPDRGGRSAARARRLRGTALFRDVPETYTRGSRRQTSTPTTKAALAIPGGETVIRLPSSEQAEKDKEHMPEPHACSPGRAITAMRWPRWCSSHGDRDLAEKAAAIHG